MARWLGCAVASVLLGVTGFGGEPAGSADDVAVRRFTLSGMIGATQGGYLFQDVNGDRLHRLLIVQHSIDTQGIGSVTFDMLAVD